MKELMTENFTAEIVQLVNTLQKELQEWDWEGEDMIDLAPKYGDQVNRLGALPVLECLIRTYSGSNLDSLLLNVKFAWEALHYDDWRRLLYRLTDSRQSLYDFVVFTGRYLAIDTCRLIASDAQVSDDVKALTKDLFPQGTPTLAKAWVCENLEDNDIDASALWQRLASEGAPMKYPSDDW
jgi:hypothetical protein